MWNKNPITLRKCVNCILIVRVCTRKMMLSTWTTSLLASWFRLLMETYSWNILAVSFVRFSSLASSLSFASFSVSLSSLNSMPFLV